MKVGKELCHYDIMSILLLSIIELISSILLFNVCVLNGDIFIVECYFDYMFY